MLFRSILFCLLITSLACHETNQQAIDNQYIVNDSFKKYWYAGEAELNSYSLEQARYGEIHQGSAVLIFVAEDFSMQKQVKLDEPDKAGADRLPVLKMNFTKKFDTGIYPYSMMLSTFSPTDVITHPHAIKTAASVQEWCGNTYTQINQGNGLYNVSTHSYFEKEGDTEMEYSVCWLEDELWNYLRITPEKLPVGKQKILPGSLYTRLTHIPLKVCDAECYIKTEGTSSIYTIAYPEQQHTLAITFETAFPHKILSWTDTYPDFNGKPLTSKAILHKTIKSNYWVHNNLADSLLRKELLF